MEVFAQKGVARLSGPEAEGFLLSPWGSPKSLLARPERCIVFDRARLELLPLFHLPTAEGEWLEKAPPQGALGPSGRARWTLGRGLPHLPDLKGEPPQVGGLEALVDWGKGCYGGQEIMARAEGQAVHRWRCPAQPP